MFKSIGYVISSLSVLLLAISSWDGVKDKPLLLACLIVGAATSIGGMGMRWISFLKNEKPSQRPATASVSSALGAKPKPAPAPDRRGSGEPRPTAR